MWSGQLFEDVDCGTGRRRHGKFWHNERCFYHHCWICPYGKKTRYVPQKEKLVRRLTMFVALIGFVTACMFELHSFRTENMFTRLYSFTTGPDNGTIDWWITDGIHDLEMV